MRVAPVSTPAAASLLGETPIVVAYGAGRPALVFDADALSSALGDAWPDVERALAEAPGAEIRGALRAAMALTPPIAEAVAPLAAAEAALLEGPDRAAAAVLLLIWAQARIAAAVER